MGVYCKEGKDGKPRWYIEYRVGGKKVRECVGASKKAAENALAVRRTEILDLTWKDVDCINGFLTIAQSKNGRIRKIPLNKILWEYLNTLSRINGYVFPCPKSLKPYSTVGFRSIFHRAMKRAGIKDCRFHDLRNTFATRLTSMNVDLPTVQELLGHSTLAMVKRYAHPTAEHKRRAVELLLEKSTHLKTLTTCGESKSTHFLPTWGVSSAEGRKDQNSKLRKVGMLQ